MAHASLEVEADRNAQRPATPADRFGDGLEAAEPCERLECRLIERRVTGALSKPDLAEVSIGLDDEGECRHASLPMTPGAGRIVLMAGDGALQGRQIRALSGALDGGGLARLCGLRAARAYGTRAVRGARRLCARSGSRRVFGRRRAGALVPRFARLGGSGRAGRGGICPLGRRVGSDRARGALRCLRSGFGRSGGEGHGIDRGAGGSLHGRWWCGHGVIVRRRRRH